MGVRTATLSPTVWTVEGIGVTPCIRVILVALILLGSIGSLKLIKIEEELDTPVAPLAGVTLDTVGAFVFITVFPVVKLKL